jgi:hypothetical protein
VKISKNFPGSEIWSQEFGKKIERNKHSLKNLRKFSKPRNMA